MAKRGQFRLSAIALSCYLLLPDELEDARSAAGAGLPIFMGHGTKDPLVPYAAGLKARDALVAAGYRVEWWSYPIPHGFSPKEIADAGGGWGACFPERSPRRIVGRGGRTTTLDEEPPAAYGRARPTASCEGGTGGQVSIGNAAKSPSKSRRRRKGGETEASRTG